MASLKQIEANRINCQRSTGPSSPQGREAVRFNALKSGIHAESQLIPGEAQEEFVTFAKNLTESCHPADAREQLFVDQMIAFGWRLGRLLKADAQAWTRCFEEIEKTVNYREDTKLADAFHCCSRGMTRLQRFTHAAQRAYRQAAADLDHLQALRAKNPLLQPQLEPQPLPEPQPAQQPTPEIGFVVRRDKPA